MSADTEQRKLAAIMFTDMVGYSALSQRDDKLALELLEEHRQLLREIFPRFHGVEIKTIGDAFLVEFNSALEAAQCAIEIQRSLAKRNADAPAARQIELKIGIHIGDVVHRGGDVYGDGVNIASRIEPLAGAGGICVSMDVERQIRNAVETRFEKLAPTELKNISVPMDLFRIVLPWERPGTPVAKTQARPKSASQKFVWGAIALILLLILGVGWWWTSQGSRHPASPAAPSTVAIAEKSIAVLPFDNLSHDPENAYFSEGIQDEILTRLAKIGNFKVISRTSTEQFRSKPGNVGEIAGQLGVANILEGSVQKAGDSVRVNVQLINALTDAHVWADTYDRKLTDIFSIESEIAKSVVDNLQAQLSGHAAEVLAARPTENPEAHELYLKGRYFWNRRNTASLRKAGDYFQQAIDLDPNYALAYAGLADVHSLLPVYAGTAPKDDVPKALAAARKAVELDANLAEAHTSLGNALSSNAQLKLAEPQFRRAIELNPNYATAHQWLAECLFAQGRFPESLAENQRAYELDPLSLIINASYASSLSGVGRNDDAIKQAHKALDLDPNLLPGHEILGQTYEAEGKLDQAITEYRKANEIEATPSNYAMLAHAYAKAGRSDETHKILDRLNELSKERYVGAYPLAIVHVALGQKDEALRLLEQSFVERDILLQGLFGSIKIDQRLDPLRSDPRFQKLVERFDAGIPE